MASNTGPPTSSSNWIQEIANALGEIVGKDAGEILKEMASSPTGDLAIPSPQAMALLGKLKTRHGFNFTRNDIVKTKKGGCCSVSLLANMVESKVS